MKADGITKCVALLLALDWSSHAKNLKETTFDMVRGGKTYSFGVVSGKTGDVIPYSDTQYTCVFLDNKVLYVVKNTEDVFFEAKNANAIYSTEMSIEATKETPKA